MRKVEYFVPRNKKELKKLIGKTVLTLTISNFTPRVYFGELGAYGEFLNPYYREDSSKNITSLIASVISFEEDYLKLRGVDRKIYNPLEKGYNERLKALQANPGMWDNQEVTV